MSTAVPISPRLVSRFIFLILGWLIFLFAQGRYTLAVAAWLAPVFLLRYSRLSRRWFDWCLLWLFVGGAWMFQFHGLAPLPIGPLFALTAATSLVGITPYILDRWLSPKFSGFASTLIFPSALAALDFATRWSPYGSWGVLAYSQFQILPLVQLVSVTGLPGLTFLVAWFAAVVNWAWNLRFDQKRIKRGAALYICIVATIYIAGFIRIRRAQALEPRTPVAGIMANFSWKFPNDAAARRFWSSQKLSDADAAAIRSSMLEQADQLLARSEGEAQAGAKIVVWSEVAAWIWRTDEPQFLRKASILSARRKIYLAAAYASVNPDNTRLHENKVVFFGPNGSRLFEYQKSRPVPGAEQAITETRPNPMDYTDTPLGRVGAFICFDMDFPDLVRQAGQDRTDIVLVPSHDWRDIDPLHSQMAVFRAVENGFNLLRDVADGRSLAVDYAGRILAEADDFTSSDHVIRANLPTHGVSTVYSKIGDAFGWLSIAATVFFITLSFFRRRVRTQ